MIRRIVSLLAVAVACGFAGAQSSRSGLTASQQQKLFQKNRAMIQAIISSNLEMSKNSGSALSRANSYRPIITEFEKELSNAAEVEDAGRIAELGKHFDTVMRQGLAPTLKAAARQIGPEGTGRPNLLEIRDDSIRLVQWLQNKARDKWSDTPEVREVLESLEKTKRDLGNSVAP